VQESLRGEIASGQFKEGDLIPSEQELAKKYAVSQGTVRRAVLDLAGQGIFSRRQGKGTFVVLDRRNRARYRNFRFLQGPGSTLEDINLGFLGLEVVPAAEDAARFLQIRKGVEVIRLERMGKIGDQQFLHSVSYLPRRLYRGLEKYTPDGFLRNTLWKIQEIDFGVRVEKREEFLSAVPADRALAKILETAIGSPLLRIQTRLTSFNDDVVEYRDTHCRTESVKFHVMQAPSS